MIISDFQQGRRFFLPFASSGFYRWGLHGLLNGGYGGFGEGSPMASPMAVNDAMVMCLVIIRRFAKGQVTRIV